jgi:hypothetical protein
MKKLLNLLHFWIARATFMFRWVRWSNWDTRESRDAINQGCDPNTRRLLRKIRRQREPKWPNLNPK